MANPHQRRQQQQWSPLSSSAPHAQWHRIPPLSALDLIPGLTFYFPPRQMERMRAAYRCAWQAEPYTYPTFQHFVLARVTAGLAERCLSLLPGTPNVNPQIAGEFLAVQLREAARQLRIDQRTLLYWFVVPEEARREQRVQALRSLCGRSMTTRWGRRGCTSSLVGLAAVGLLLCGLLSFAEAAAALLLHSPH